MLMSKAVFKERRLTRVDSMCYCSKRRYIYACTPRQFFEVVQPFTATGPAEVKPLVDMITPLVVGTTKDPTDKRKQIFSESVHIAMDNHFSGDDALRYLGEGG
jgi:hypothetical protein